jgi:hypothetical protein
MAGHIGLVGWFFCFFRPLFLHFLTVITASK